jgi:hypothetical protein
VSQPDEAQLWKTMAYWGTEVGPEAASFLLDIKRQGDTDIWPGSAFTSAVLKTRGDLLVYLGHNLRARAAEYEARK